MKERLRLFVGLPLGELARAAVAARMESFRARAPRARWVRPEKLHLTLAFLGGCAPEALPPLAELLGEVGPRHAPLELRFTTLDGFGVRRRPKVFFLNVEGELTRLHSLQGELSSGLARLSHPQEARGFHPHLTLARARDPRGDPALGGCLGEGGPEIPDRIDRLVLFESRTVKGEARYEQHVVVRLGSGA